ncbi:TonB-dependent receptor [Flavobacterium columnare]|uniref:TonB-dependent receptor plug domain-containing protein n=1 Tax=Flavobacterium columnare TaxID=996 RepID=UPI0007F9D1E3|nr:TonB-dependent receptor plug domain-containing protein [Flavobacterium columnare]ANO47940.1 putative TonB-dependent outer membrane receptor [Flavobacterium columnare]PDS23097.1 TonB-dependent receptor [Flavobacterium columnare] [Flavobacterium columnare NBRC 100251 = ATCC 23463]QOG88851.1 TonB-dependent receptor [Flavobacterium columnare]QOG91510.1 TonB-dependent receptor [Flavobacterium columnare]QOG94173.1 TonB-dependent receptor [Flavobacterium columnare]
MKKNILLASVLTCMYGSAFAQEQESKKIEEVVVSETKFLQNKTKTGRTIEKITSKDLEQRKGQSVATVLSQLAGFEVVGSQSGVGKNLDLFVRGGSTKQVLILIDGNPVVDASSISTTYDLRLLPVEQVESIEVLKGASSVLYGANAATAVINITLKKATDKGVVGTAYFNIGTQNLTTTKKYKPEEYNQGFSLNGTKGKISFLTSLNSAEITGISEAKGDDFEKDKFSRVNLNQQLGVAINKEIKLDFFANYDRLRFAYDTGAFVDNEVNTLIGEQFRGGFSPSMKYKKGELKINSSFGFYEQKRLSGVSLNNYTESFSKSRNINVDVFNKYNIGNSLAFITGVQFQYFDMLQATPYVNIYNQDAKYTMLDPYITAVLNTKFGLNVNAGARYLKHSVYKDYVIFNINPSFNFEKINLKLYGSIGGAVVAPTLYQVYSEYGNKDLTPQENTTIEAGFEKSFFDQKMKISAVGFYREENNSIAFKKKTSNTGWQYENIEGINKSKGIESNIMIKPLEKITLTGNYTFVENDQAIAKAVAKHRINASLSVELTKSIAWDAQFQFVDFRNVSYYNSSTFRATDVSVSAYKLFHTNLKVKLSNHLSVFGSVQNLLNEEFIETMGYNTRGRNFKIGMNFQF